MTIIFSISTRSLCNDINIVINSTYLFLQIFESKVYFFKGVG